MWLPAAASKKKKQPQIYPAGQKTWVCVSVAINGASCHFQGSLVCCILFFILLEMALSHAFSPAESQTRHVALSLAGDRRGWLSQNGGVLWRCTQSVATHHHTESICGDTARSGRVLWRYFHTQSHTQSNTQSNATNGLDRAWFWPLAQSNWVFTPTQTPKIAPLRPYRDTLSQHFVHDLGANEQTPSLAAGGEQGGIYG